MASGLAKRLAEAIELAETGRTAEAKPLFEQLMRLEVNPLVCSYLALCTAREEGEFVNAVMLCRQVIRDDPDNPTHYLNLGRIYLHAGRRNAAIQTLRGGFRIAPHPTLHALLESLGFRQRPPLPFLQRQHPLNKFLGRLRHRLRLSRPDPLQLLPDPEKS
jgi:tetratricopeptide (TPR) repeat protein